MDTVSQRQFISETEWDTGTTRHTWKLEHFLETIEFMKPSEELFSAKFPVTSKSGITQYYQICMSKKKKSAKSKHISCQHGTLGVYLVNKTSGNVAVKFSLGLQNKRGKLWARPLIQIRSMKPEIMCGWDCFFHCVDFRSRPKALLEDGTLTLICDLTIFSSNSTKFSVCGDTPAFDEALKNGARISDGISSLLLDPQHSDITLICCKSSFPCHKAVLSTRSEYFKTMFSKKDTAEEQSNKVFIEDMKPIVLQRVIEVMYSDNFDDAVTQEMACDLLQAADRFMLPLLKIACEKILSKSIEIENAASVLVHALNHNAEMLKNSALRYIRINAEKVTATAGFGELMKMYPLALKGEVSQM